MNEFHEPQEELEGVLPLGEIIDIETMEVSEETKQQVTNAGLDFLRSVLRGLDRYAIFASTAKYIHGRSKNVEEFLVAPGDFDIAVFDERALLEIRERLVRADGVEFLNVEPTEEDISKGKRYLTSEDLIAGRDVVFESFPTEPTQILKGRIVLSLETDIGFQRFAIPFEIFLNSRIVGPDFKRYAERTEGLSVLSLEGLKKQYGKNLELESRLMSAINNVRAYLDKRSHRADFLAEAEQQKNGEGRRSRDPYLQANLELLGLSFEDVVRYYDILDAYEKIPHPTVFERGQKELAISKLLSGLKTKLEKRQASFEQLHSLQSIVAGEEDGEGDASKGLAAK